MVRINKVYTRKGDTGETSLVGGKRVLKNSLRVEAFGEIDEVNSILGLVRSMAGNENKPELNDQLALVQNELFDLGAELANPNLTSKENLRVSEQTIKRLEDWIDQCTADLPELRSFVLPGGTEINSHLHIARAVCRRAERRIVALSQIEALRPEIIKFINRLSDWLFVLSRKELKDAGLPEFLWEPGKKS